MKSILIWLLLFLGIAAKAQFYDSAFYKNRIVSLQSQILKQADRNHDVYIESGLFYPDSGYAVRFLFFKIDSLGNKIKDWVFTDEKGVKDTLGFTSINVRNILINWKAMFSMPLKYDCFTFIQPILYRTNGLAKYSISQFPNVDVDASQVYFYFYPYIKLPQIDIKVNKPIH